MKRNLLIATLLVATCVAVAFAQPPRGGRPQEGGPDGGPPGGFPGGEGFRPPPNPVMEALDADRDHKLSADEIAKAADALKSLDKNSDGELTEDEFRPEPPVGGPGVEPGRGPGPGQNARGRRGGPEADQNNRRGPGPDFGPPDALPGGRPNGDQFDRNRNPEARPPFERGDRPQNNQRMRRPNNGPIDGNPDQRRAGRPGGDRPEGGRPDGNRPRQAGPRGEDRLGPPNQDGPMGPPERRGGERNRRPGPGAPGGAGGSDRPDGPDNQGDFRGPPPGGPGFPPPRDGEQFEDRGPPPPEGQPSPEGPPRRNRRGPGGNENDGAVEISA